MPSWAKFSPPSLDAVWASSSSSATTLRKSNGSAVPSPVPPLRPSWRSPRLCIPPAGATALLAVVDPTLIQVGWFLIPVMLLGCALMLGAALLINNLERRFPVYWWSPEDLRQPNSLFRRRHSKKKAPEAAADEAKPEEASERYVSDLEAATDKETEREDAQHAADIIIKPGQVIVPEHVYLTQEEQQYLETLCKRL
ncbi:uncharacterized protein TrAtP1_007520 [Trichoderma atroviride]|uniref:uncharacterized protein n=1 Tax=Hypocrea atroviridis TaxID=63577 RepID=UPI0033217B2E|nr:hypothetical protein TrAtP1_007520 [Trichoderma atroviride]